MTKEHTMRKLLQHTFFAAMLAWALHGIQAQLSGDAPAATTPNASYSVAVLAQR